MDKKPLTRSQMLKLFPQGVSEFMIDGRAWVCGANGMMFHVLPDGKRAYAYEFDWVGDFDGEGLAPATLGNDRFLIGYEGNRVD